MAKRFTDTDKYKKPFFRGLQGAYKLLWDYLYHDCNHAGIWIVDFEVAQIYIGSDMPVNKKDALNIFNEGKKRIIEFEKGKWFIPSFIDFQYKVLSENNNAHKSVIDILTRNKLYKNNKVLVSPSRGAMDKDKDKDKEMDKDKAITVDVFFENIWNLYPNKKGKSSISNSKKKELFKIGFDRLKVAVNNYKKSTNGTEKIYLKHGSSFFNTNYVDYLEENYDSSLNSYDPKDASQSLPDLDEEPMRNIGVDFQPGDAF